MFKWLKEIKRVVAPKIPSTKKSEIATAPVENSSTKKISLESNEKVCVVCGKTFTPKANGQKYCSKECGRDAKLLNDRSRYAKYPKRKAQEEKTCQICGKTFSTVYGWQRYCSKECKHEGRNLRARRSYARHPKRSPKTEKTCQTCGKTFLANESNQKFCSEECRLKSHRAHHEEKVYPVCGKTFTAKSSIQKFCSKECCNAVYNPPGQIVKCRVCGKEFRRGKGQAKSCTECRAMPKVMPKRPQEEKTCPVCQEKFLPVRRSQIYCSTRCRVKVDREREKVRRKLLAPKPAPIAEAKPQEIKPRACIFCGKIFTPEKNSTRMCSPECERKYQESKLIEKTCPYCKKVFKTKKSNQKFCSHACQYKGHAYISPERLLPRACEVCGETFTPKTPSQKVCSDECRNKKWNVGQKRDAACFLCEKKFTTTKGYQKFCSTACQEKSDRLRAKARKIDARKKSSEWLTTSPPEERECMICGKIFAAPSDSDKKFCSTFCELVDDYRKNNQSKEKVEKKPEKKKTLTDWQKEAHQCGMSYGMYRAQIERFGKTFEELVIR